MQERDVASARAHYNKSLEIAEYSPNPTQCSLWYLLVFMQSASTASLCRTVALCAVTRPGRALNALAMPSLSAVLTRGWHSEN